MFSLNQTVVFEDSAGVPVHVGVIDKETAKYVEVDHMRFSKNTGLRYSPQPSFPVQIKLHSVFGENKYLDDVVYRIRPFDLNQLEVKEFKNQKLYLELESGQTIRESVEGLMDQSNYQNIPRDAEITEVNGNEVWVDYERIETLKEYMYRVFIAPRIEAKLKEDRMIALKIKQSKLKEELEKVQNEMSLL